MSSPVPGLSWGPFLCVPQTPRSYLLVAIVQSLLWLYIPLARLLGTHDKSESILQYQAQSLCTENSQKILAGTHMKSKEKRNQKKEALCQHASEFQLLEPSRRTQKVYGRKMELKFKFILLPKHLKSVHNFCIIYIFQELLWNTLL